MLKEQGVLQEEVLWHLEDAAQRCVHINFLEDNLVRGGTDVQRRALLTRHQSNVTRCALGGHCEVDSTELTLHRITRPRIRIPSPR